MPITKINVLLVRYLYFMDSFMHYTGERLATLYTRNSPIPSNYNIFCSFENTMRAYNN